MTTFSRNETIFQMRCIPSPIFRSKYKFRMIMTTPVDFQSNEQHIQIISSEVGKSARLFEFFNDSRSTYLGPNHMTRMRSLLDDITFQSDILVVMDELANLHYRFESAKTEEFWLPRIVQIKVLWTGELGMIDLAEWEIAATLDLNQKNAFFIADGTVKEGEQFKYLESTRVVLDESSIPIK